MSINKIKKAKIFINICAVIKKVIGGGKYLLKISNNYEEYNLKKRFMCSWFQNDEKTGWRNLEKNN